MRKGKMSRGGDADRWAVNRAGVPAISSVRRRPDDGRWRKLAKAAVVGVIERRTQKRRARAHVPMIRSLCGLFGPGGPHPPGDISNKKKLKKADAAPKKAPLHRCGAGVDTLGVQR